MKSLKKPNKKFTRHAETNTIFRKYLTNMVEEMGEPLLHYKNWEMHLRNKPINEELKSVMVDSEPLTPLLQEKIKQIVFLKLLELQKKKMEIVQ